MTAKKHRSWDRQLKEAWRKLEIRNCELCGGTFGLALAHSKKRRFIQTREDYFEVALLCQSCHDNLEFGGHERMAEKIREIIRRR